MEFRQVAKELEVQHTLFVQMDKMLKSRNQSHLHNIKKGYLNAKKMKLRGRVQLIITRPV